MAKKSGIGFQLFFHWSFQLRAADGLHIFNNKSGFLETLVKVGEILEIITVLFVAFSLTCLIEF